LLLRRYAPQRAGKPEGIGRRRRLSLASCGGAKDFGLHQFGFEETRDAIRDAVLNGEDVVSRRVEGFGPEMRTALHVDDARVQAHSAPLSRDGAGKRIADAARVRPAVIRDHPEPAHAGKRAQRCRADPCAR
jgi:hypothetical protein